MPRRVPADRLLDVARTACTVFIDKGYRRTLMTDVGAALGFSHALLYRYVASKEALFQLALHYAVDPGRLDDLPVPLPTPAPGELLEPLTGPAGGGTLPRFPVLAAALATDRADDIRAEFTAVVDELYGVLERYHLLLSLIERSTADLPELHAWYVGGTRQRQVDGLHRYLEARTATGQLRPAPDPEVATRFVVEAVAWFAWHRRGDPTAAGMADDVARRTVLDLLATAFVPASVP